MAHSYLGTEYRFFPIKPAPTKNGKWNSAALKYLHSGPWNMGRKEGVGLSILEPILTEHQSYKCT